MVVVLIAPPGMGKTTACQRAVELARERGLRVAGVISPPVYHGEEKAAILLRAVSTGEERRLARRAVEGDRPTVGKWVFDEEVVTWGNRVLESVGDCDLLVIDEIGPLELEQGGGLTSALPALRNGHYRLAVVSMRPWLAAVLEAALPGLRLRRMVLDGGNRDQVPSHLLMLLRRGEAACVKAAADRKDDDGDERTQ